MASASTLSALSLAGTVFSTSSRHHTEGRRSTSVRFHRPLSISAACASTAERTAVISQFKVSSPASLYEVLGIEMGASCREIKAAYRRLAREVHPDVAATHIQKGQDRATAAISGPGEFIKVHEAYATLSDPVKRAHYDRFLCTRSGIHSLHPTLTMGSSGYRGRKWETDQCW